MFHKNSTEVLVVGAGPIGLWTAVLLSERGIPFKILDQEWRSGQHSYAVTLHPSTLKMLSEVGLISEVLEHGRRIDTIGLYDGHVRQGEIDLSKLKTDYPFLVVLPQSFLEGIFERKILKQGADLSWNRSLRNLKVDGGRVKATVEKLGWESSGYSVSDYEIEIEGSEEIDTQYVIGADGYDSSVRRILGIPFDEMGSPELFAAIEFETDIEMGSDARFTMANSRRSVLWPLPGGRCRGVFQMDPSEVKGTQMLSRVQNTVQIGRKTYPRVPDPIAEDLVKKGAPSFSGKIGNIDWSTFVRFEKRLARTFGKGAIWLCGDSARTTGPIGVQSMNSGFAEAFELVSKISLVRTGGALELMNDYSKECLTQWRRMFAGDSRIMDLPATGPDLVQLVAQLGLSFTRSEGDKFAQAV